MYTRHMINLVKLLSMSVVLPFDIFILFVFFTYFHNGSENTQSLYFGSQDTIKRFIHGEATKQTLQIYNIKSQILRLLNEYFDKYIGIYLVTYIHMYIHITYT